ncbi:Type 11 methyltransferase [Acidobacteriia bacterium SbA2]|nr:Type 11 methyltransferase [Acidobacteriia bacterium SbA2]
MGIRASIDLKLDPSAAFDALVGELSTALLDLGMQFEPGAQGRVTEGAKEVGRVTSWQPNEKIALEWRGADWQPGDVTAVELRFEPVEIGTRVTLEQPDLSTVLGEKGDEIAGWFAREVAAPLLHSLAPRKLGDWITDRRARRPSGPQSRATYRDPLYHRPNFKVILSVLDLTQNDYLLEVGCGGGAFLEDALKSGCKAAAIDHSPEMVRLAGEVNREAIDQHRLEIRLGKADSLPFPDDTFTCAVMTGVFGFIQQPLKALSEVRRTLGNGGRFVLFTGAKELRGTPAAPEPVASRLFFYEDEELEELARKAGFAEAKVERPDFEQAAREVGIPQEALELFKGKSGGQLLVAHKGS